jgi:NTE family protein
VTFRHVQVPLLVSTVDLARGAQVIWGLPGLQDVPVADAVYASCALPGFFPPRVIAGRTCVDGGVIDNLPTAIAVRGMDAVIGVDVGSSSLTTERRIKDKGFAAIYARAAQTMMKSLQVAQLSSWAGPPLLLVRPPVWHFPMFSFTATTRMLDAGYTAACDALDRAGAALSSAGGVYPRRTLAISVIREKCIGCTLCATLAPTVMAMDDEHKARVIESPLELSRPEGEFIHQCPTDAIRVAEVKGRSHARTKTRASEPG